MNTSSAPGLLRFGLAATSLALLLHPAAAHAWGNRSAHPAINAQAYKLLDQQLSDAGLSLQLDPLTKFAGEAVFTPGRFSIESGTRSLTAAGWVSHGGFSADEPEVFAAWRHLYDPLSSNGATWVTDGVPDGWGVNPQIDAKTWALSHADNPYSLAQVLTAFKDGMEGREPEANFAKSWRGLGEVMHLLADMVQPAHVRNDSHAFSEPLEDSVNRAMVEQYAAGAVDARAEVSGYTIADMFERLARFTNSAFYSRDTLHNPADPAVAPENGQTPNPAPTFAQLTWDAQLQQGSTTVAGREVPLLAERFSSYVARKADPAEPPRYSVYSFFAPDQAAVLVPIAVAANAELIRRFLPELQLWAEVNGGWVPEGTGSCSLQIGGRLNHTISTASEWTGMAPILYSGPGTLLRLQTGQTTGVPAGTVTFKDGVVTSPLPRSVPVNTTDPYSYMLEVRAGGMVVRSGVFSLSCSDSICVPPGTAVRMADGTSRPIERVQAGDQVSAYDFQTGRGIAAEVQQLLVHAEREYALDAVQMEGGEELRLTENHPVWVVGRGYVAAAQLAPGDRLLVRDPASGVPAERPILSIVRAASRASVVYNLKTSTSHYFAADILVHNKCLARGSLVETPEGPRPVETLRPGDVVWGEREGRRGAARVERVFSKRTILETLPGRPLAADLVVTVNHAVLAEQACQSAADVPGPTVPVEGEVFDLATDTGNYFAGGVLLEAASDED